MVEIVDVATSKKAIVKANAICMNHFCLTVIPFLFVIFCQSSQNPIMPKRSMPNRKSHTCSLDKLHHKRVVIITTPRINRPPIVGILFLSLCLSGVFSRAWLAKYLFDFLMNHEPVANVSTNAVSNDAMVRKLI